MGFADRYLQKHATGNPLIPSAPDPRLHSIIAIPAYNESGLTNCLDSLFSCTLPDAPAEVIVLINSGEQTPRAIIALNRNTYRDVLKWSASRQRPGLTFHTILLENLPRKHFGAGLARKLVMDEAVRRFNQVDRAAGIILSLDADTLVEQDYLAEVTGLFDRAPAMDGCSIRFAHPLEPSAVEEDKITREIHPAAVYNAVVNYELHQRYYLEAVRYTGYPHAYHTVGSAFAVRAGAYCRQGGMSKRHAGEDFYFIQKVAMQGNFSECNTTTVHPSPRPSDRVPFGTGPAIARQLTDSDAPYLTYAPDLFRHLRSFYALIPDFFACGTSPVTQHMGTETGPPSEPHSGPHSELLSGSQHGPHSEPHSGPHSELLSGSQHGPHSEPHSGPHSEPPKQSPSEPPKQSPSEPPALPAVRAVLSCLPALLRQFLEETGFLQELAEIHRNVAGETAFRQRFYRKFNMFRILKYLHYAGEHGVEKLEVGTAAREMLEMQKAVGSRKGTQGSTAKDMQKAVRNRKGTQGSTAKEMQKAVRNRKGTQGSTAKEMPEMQKGKFAEDETRRDLLAIYRNIQADPPAH